MTSTWLGCSIAAGLLLAPIGARADEAPSFGVICIAPLPAPAAYATAGKCSATPESYRDDAASRAARVKAAEQQQPVVFSVGEVKSGPVTARDAQCIDRVPLGSPQQLLAGGRLVARFTLTAAEPVRWLTASPFYGNDRLDPLPARLYCPRRSPTPDCTWCPCKARRYLPPPAASREPK